MEGIVIVILLVVLYLVILIRERLNVPVTQKGVLKGIEILLSLIFLFYLGDCILEMGLVHSRNFALGIALFLIFVFTFSARKISSFKE